MTAGARGCPSSAPLTDPPRDPPPPDPRPALREISRLLDALEAAHADAPVTYHRPPWREPLDRLRLEIAQLLADPVAP